MTWTSLDTWIVTIALLSALACAVPGVYLVLRKMSMMGDAISHAVLPGLAVAFLWTGSRDSIAMFWGAAVVGILTAVFVDWINRVGKVEEGASMGVVFTTLFALGLIILVRAADKVDLDPGCVLYGALELVPLDTVTFAGLQLPRAVFKLTFVLLLNIGFVTLFFKELLITTFDPGLSKTQGISPKLLNFLLMAMVAITAVASFESVGSILVIAMLIVPAATAQLLTDRVGPLLWLACGVAAASAVLGHVSALTIPTYFGFDDTNTAGMMAVVAGALFTLAVLLAPRKGILSRWRHRLELNAKMLEEDILGYLYRLEESDARGAVSTEPERLDEALFTTPWPRNRALRRLKAQGAIASLSPLELSKNGRERARQLVRSHRIWEVYLNEHLNTPHVHTTAHRLEHTLDPGEMEILEMELDFPSEDPHGKPIPRKSHESNT